VREHPLARSIGDTEIENRADSEVAWRTSHVDAKLRDRVERITRGEVSEAAVRGITSSHR
jgi:hypothetical protein